MRLRNVKRAFERIDDYDQIIGEPQQHMGKWHEFFGNTNEIHIEIGMGKGQFLIGLARQNPNINYIGFEKFTVVLVKGLEKIDKEKDLPNLYVVRYDADDILEMFGTNEVSRIYLNFSDPWPKDRHSKRRLTNREFLLKYKNVLKNDGLLRFKTDNDDLFRFSIEEMNEVGMIIHKKTSNLHMSEWAAGNIMTEYETKFAGEGLTINMVEATFV